jgi:5-formyltetrahydrofolate cyclo-ligase
MSDHVPFALAEAPLVMRLRLRRARAGLSNSTLLANSAAISRHALRCLRMLGPRTLAGYFGIRGEIDLTDLLERQAAAGVRIAMPVLERHRPGRMHFRVWSPAARLCHNAFGIPEPCHGAPRIWRRELDVVLLPLVAFDAEGHRLGMGGGYYDRYFAPRRLGTVPRPRLIGVAHAFQQVPRLERQPWDVPLDGVITEHGWSWFRRRS